MTAEDLFQLGVKAMMQNPQGEILVIREAGCPWWDLPGGRVERGEAALAALRRELGEEIGVTAELAAAFVGATVSQVRIPVGPESVGLVLFAYAVPLPPVIQPPAGTEVAWVTPMELYHRLSGKYPADFLALLGARAQITA